MTLEVTLKTRQNDFKLQSHEKVTVLFGAIFKVGIMPNDTVTFLCACIYMRMVWD